MEGRDLEPLKQLKHVFFQATQIWSQAFKGLSSAFLQEEDDYCDDISVIMVLHPAASI